jgi:hypothetical protein
VADYTPVYGKPQSLSYTAGAAITAGQLLYFSATDTVSPSTASAAGGFAGVAGQDAASGAQVTVLAGAGLVHETAVGTAVTAGAPVYMGAAGAASVTQGTVQAANLVGYAVRALAGAGTLRWKSAVG